MDGRLIPIAGENLFDEETRPQRYRARTAADGWP